MKGNHLRVYLAFTGMMLYYKHMLNHIYRVEL